MLNLFKNSGKKIMNYVKFVFIAATILILLGVLVGAIVVWATTERFGAGFLTLVLGGIGGVISIALTYLSVLCLYAFGEMVQNSIEQTKLLKMMAGVKEMPAEVPHARPAAPSAPYGAPPARPAAPSAPYGAPPARPAAPNAPYGAPPARPAAPAGDKVICPKCGARQIASGFCKYCGTPLR